MKNNEVILLQSTVLFQKMTLDLSVMVFNSPYTFEIMYICIFSDKTYIYLYQDGVN